jgi:hypothetical protein
MSIPRRVYRTRLFDTDGHGAWAPPYRGRCWQGDLRFLDVEEGAYYRAIPELPAEVKRYNPPRHFVPPKDAKPVQLAIRSAAELGRSEKRLQFAPEIMIHASDRPTAQRAANLILAAASVAQGYQRLEELVALPEPGEPLEDLDELEYDLAANTALLEGGWARA